MNQEWVEVSNFPEYEIHPKNGIRRKGKDTSLKGRNWMGYPKVTLMNKGKKHERRIHKLVAEHFISNPKKLPIVNHRDSNRNNHSSDNLEWVDNSGNQLHRWKTQKEGLKKMKYEKEYGLKKVALLHPNKEVVLRDKMGGAYKMSQLSLSDKMKIENIAKMRGAGYRGDTEATVGGSLKKLRIEINDKDRNMKAGNMLYKETNIGKTASAYASILKKTVKNSTRVPNQADKIMGKGAIDMNKIKTYGKIGAGLTAVGGLAALKS